MSAWLATTLHTAHYTLSTPGITEDLHHRPDRIPKIGAHLHIFPFSNCYRSTLFISSKTPREIISHLIQDNLSQSLKNIFTKRKLLFLNYLDQKAFKTARIASKISQQDTWNTRRVCTVHVCGPMYPKCARIFVSPLSPVTPGMHTGGNSRLHSDQPTRSWSESPTDPRDLLSELIVWLERTAYGFQVKHSTTELCPLIPLWGSFKGFRSQ